MKKTALVLFLAMMLVMSMASVAMAKNAGSPAVSGTGYVSWSVVDTTAVTAQLPVALGAEQLTGPHGNYTTSTIKCAVCHSTHGAPDGAFLLTQATGSSATANVACSYCHGIGSTASSKIVSLAMGSSTDHHSSRCAADDGCHAASPHGVGVSTYPLMATRLINVKVDTLIANAISNSTKTGLDAAYFNNAANADGFKVVTGYVCGQAACHVDSAFAVRTRGLSQYTNNDSGVNPTWKTGHPVLKAADATYAPPVGARFVTATGKAVAWKSTNGCVSCHDATDSARGGATRFPHNVGTSVLWMQQGPDATGVGTADLTDPWVADGADYGSVLDGACLKCHVKDAAGTEGVGINY